VAAERGSYRRTLGYRAVARTSRAAMGCGAERGQRRIGLGFGGGGVGRGVAWRDARAGADRLGHA
jgi:hypothetical protein